MPAFDDLRRINRKATIIYFAFDLLFENGDDLRMTGSAADAEDIVQDTFVKVLDGGRCLITFRSKLTIPWSGPIEVNARRAIRRLHSEGTAVTRKHGGAFRQRSHRVGPLSGPPRNAQADHPREGVFFRRRESPE
jgi:hypothetical protein